MSASGAGNVEVVELLLELGMKPNTSSHTGDTPLMAAASDGSPKVARLLIKAGAKVNAANKQNKTALMYAAEGYKNGDILKVLLENGADPYLKANGKTALELCKENSNHFGAKARIKILKEAMKNSSR